LLLCHAGTVDFDVAHANTAAGGCFQQVQAAQEGRLARTAGADDGHHFAGGDLQIDALEHRVTIELLCQALYHDHCFTPLGRGG
jgi:hypothetical protein